MCRWGAALALASMLTSRIALAEQAVEPATPEEEETPLPTRAAPSRWRLFLGAPVTWRHYCARPGVTSCNAFDTQPPESQVGAITDFDSKAPYVGVGAEVELFPLADWRSPLRGVGLTLNYQRGFARTEVRTTSSVGSSPTRVVHATDTSYGGMLAYRYFFDLGKTGTPLWGYGGLRLGALGRAFESNETGVEAPLPVVHRFFPAVGLDVSVPLMRAVRLEGAGQFFLQPTPGNTLGGGDGSRAAEVRDYGTSVSGLGWAAELGVAGELWGPFGYSARFRLESFQDHFTGEGFRLGWSSGGVAEDTYSSILAGVTAAW
jgi:hypothetical protein